MSPDFELGRLADGLADGLADELVSLQLLLVLEHRSRFDVDGLTALFDRAEEGGPVGFSFFLLVGKRLHGGNTVFQFAIFLRLGFLWRSGVV